MKLKPLKHKEQAEVQEMEFSSEWTKIVVHKGVELNVTVPKGFKC